LEDLGIDGRVIVKSLLKESVGKWIDLAQGRYSGIVRMRL
jgi:hypothetical protein